MPQAEFGGVWIIGAPSVAQDLKAIGFDVMSRANNHATDWGLEGMRQTSRELDAAGIVHAGVGEHRAAARAARYFDTDKGRVALISIASTFTPLSRSAPPVGQAPGRPGVNALRTTRYSLVTADELRALRKIRDEQPAGSVRLPEQEPADELELFGVRYKAGDRRGFTYTMDPVDEREILRSVRAAKQLSDFVIVTIHAHEPGNWSQEPADFLPKLAHAAIDAGADEFIGHGPAPDPRHRGLSREADLLQPRRLHLSAGSPRAGGERSLRAVQDGSGRRRPTRSSTRCGTGWSSAATSGTRAW